MFKKIRFRLTALNATVFFVILACLGGIVYTDLRHQLYVKVDESLRSKLQDTTFFYAQFIPPADDNALPGSKKTLIQMQGGIDPRVFLVLWDEQGNPFGILAGSENHAVVKDFKPYRNIRDPETIKVGDHYYRFYGVEYNKPVNMNVKILSELSRVKGLNLDEQSLSENTIGSRIVAVQAISIVDSEQNILRRLLEIMLFSIFGGGAVTVLAGVYLANKALQPIRNSWDKQQQFVADASHELRMPISVIKANAELVFRHPNRSILEMSESLSMVLTESVRMGRLTDQLLTLARADSNQEEILFKPILLGEVIQEVIKKFEPLAELKSQRLEVQLDSELEMLGDRDRLHQLFVILIDNSMKFTQEDGVIRVAARKNGSTIEVTVEDTGIGISAEDLPHIFDRFYRGDKSRSRDLGGTGLGLAIAKWIVDRHEGDIAASSVQGQGATITLRLPTKQKKS